MAIQIVITVLLAVLIVLVLVLLLKGKQPEWQGLEEKVDAALKANLLQFQNTITQTMSATQTEVARSKDLIADHLVKSLDNMKQMGGTIQKLVHQQEEAARLGQGLKDLLQAPKLRGNYGEEILEEMLDRVLPAGIWEKQVHIEGAEAVDAAVKFKDVLIPVDAKFPRDDYNRYLEADDTAKPAAWKAFEEAVRRQIASISSKYIKPEHGTAGFAIMFIPSEAVYYETIAEKNSLGGESKLYDYARSHNVVPASPNTFYAFLQVLMLGIRNLEMIKGAQKLQENLRSVEKSFDFFYKQYEDIGKHLDKAAEAYRKGDGHVGRFKDKLETTLKLEGTAPDGDDTQE